MISSTSRPVSVIVMRGRVASDGPARREGNHADLLRSGNGPHGGPIETRRGDESLRRNAGPSATRPMQRRAGPSEVGQPAVALCGGVPKAEQDPKLRGDYALQPVARRPRPARPKYMLFHGGDAGAGRSARFAVVQVPE